jgi:pyruvate/2-oxoglutarate dehydrogenase complex dihydrolipoamide dehydrogenase (E3) component
MSAPSTSTPYDAIVIGAGQAGPGVAGELAESGRRVALVEMAEVGGTCLNHGCKPTKALRASAVVAQQARRAAEYGVTTGPVTVDLVAALRRVHRIIDEMRESLADWVAGVNALDLLYGTASLVSNQQGPHQVLLDGHALVAPEIYLNLGARASIPSWPGLDEVDFLTEVELLHLDRLPEHLIVVGGGYIGLEFGQMFRRFGSAVTIIAGGGIAPREDADVSQIIADIIAAEGVVIERARTQGVARTSDGVEVLLDHGGRLAGTHLLVATGRRSNIDLLGDRHGLEVDGRGFVVVDDRFATSMPGIWALGDVNGRGAFTHTAYQDGQILLSPPRSLADRVTTYAMFTDPPLGRVGMTVTEAKRSGLRVLVAETSMDHVTRAILEGETDGLIRILVDADSERFLGATILGLHADDLVQAISFAMQAGVRYPQVRDALPIHPTMAEYLPSVLRTLRPLT